MEFISASILSSSLRNIWGEGPEFLKMENANSKNIFRQPQLWAKVPFSKLLEYLLVAPSLQSPTLLWGLLLFFLCSTCQFLHVPTCAAPAPELCETGTWDLVNVCWVELCWPETWRPTYWFCFYYYLSLFGDKWLNLLDHSFNVSETSRLDQMTPVSFSWDLWACFSTSRALLTKWGWSLDSGLVPNQL